jgi:hypothetical protein
MNDIPAAAYEGVDVLAQRECDSELDSDYRREGADKVTLALPTTAIEFTPLAGQEMAFLKWGWF